MIAPGLLKWVKWGFFEWQEGRWSSLEIHFKIGDCFNLLGCFIIAFKNKMYMYVFVVLPSMKSGIVGIISNSFPALDFQHDLRI